MQPRQIYKSDQIYSSDKLDVQKSLAVAVFFLLVLMDLKGQAFEDAICEEIEVNKDDWKD